MIRQADQRSRDAKSVADALRAKFPGVQVKPFGMASVRVRIIDRRFVGKSKVQRERLVAPLIDRLPEDVQSGITVLLLLAPGEEQASAMNFEFEHPSRSTL